MKGRDRVKGKKQKNILQKIRVKNETAKIFVDFDGNSRKLYIITIFAKHLTLSVSVLK